MGAGPSRAYGSAPTASPVTPLEATSDNVLGFVQTVEKLSNSMLSEVKRQAVAGLLKQAQELFETIVNANPKPNQKGKQPKLDFSERFNQLRQELANIRHALRKTASQEVVPLPRHLPGLSAGLNRAATIAALQGAAATQDERGDSLKLREMYLNQINHALKLSLLHIEEQQGLTLHKEYFSEEIKAAKEAIELPDATEDDMRKAVNTFENKLDDILKDTFKVEPVGTPSFREQPSQGAFTKPPAAVEEFFDGADISFSTTPPGSPRIDAWIEAACIEEEQRLTVKLSPVQAGLNTITQWRDIYAEYVARQGDNVNFVLLPQLDKRFNQAEATITNSNNSLDTIQPALETLKKSLLEFLPGIQLTPIQLSTATPSQPIPIPASSLIYQPNPLGPFNPPSGPGPAQGA